MRQRQKPSLPRQNGHYGSNASLSSFCWMNAGKNWWAVHEVEWEKRIQTDSVRQRKVMKVHSDMRDTLSGSMLWEEIRVSWSRSHQKTLPGATPKSGPGVHHCGLTYVLRCVIIPLCVTGIKDWLPHLMWKYDYQQMTSFMQSWNV